MFREDEARGVASVFVLMLALGLAASAQTDSATSTPGIAKATSQQKLGQSEIALRAIVVSGRLETLRWPVFSDYRAHVEQFYRPFGYSLAWVQHGEPTTRALEVIDVLRQADREGLGPDDYDSPRWTDRLSHLAGPHTPSDEVRFDVALTVCTMRYVSDVRIGRINPKHLKFHLDVQHKKLDLPRFVRQLLVSGVDVKSELADIEPPFAVYKETRKALLKYMELAKKDDGDTLPVPAVTLYPGAGYEGIARLFHLLRLVGDLPEDAAAPVDSTYQGQLVEAVKRFQKRHGLRDNGFLTAETLTQMNVPLSDRVEQIRLALERFRWVRYDFPQPPIIVNIPEFRLYALDDQGRISFSMNVNVGDAYDFQTPIFENTIRYLVFRPYWNVPPRILRNEIVRDVEEDRDYIKDNNMEVLTPAGVVVTSGRISDAVLQQLRSGRLRVREKPGPENALGLLKIIFPNDHHVYMHDTPEGVDMFSQDQRALSHGCIHLQEPSVLAAWLLRHNPDWTLERVEHAMNEGHDDFTLHLAKQVPVVLFYTTVVAREHGDISFYRDIYGHDVALERHSPRGIRTHAEESTATKPRTRQTLSAFTFRKRPRRYCPSDRQELA